MIFGDIFAFNVIVLRRMLKLIAFNGGIDGDIWLVNIWALPTSGYLLIISMLRTVFTQIGYSTLKRS